MKDSGQMGKRMEEGSIMMLQSNSAMKESGKMVREKDLDIFILKITISLKELFKRITKMDLASKSCIMVIRTKVNT